MNNLQSGVSGGQLSPQSFTNSPQNTSFQDTYDSSGLQQTTEISQSINTLTARGSLRVEVGSSSQKTLGVSMVAQTQNNVSTPQAQNVSNSKPAWFIIVLVAVMLAAYVVRRILINRSKSNEGKLKADLNPL